MDILYSMAKTGQVDMYISKDLDAALADYSEKDVPSPVTLFCEPVLENFKN
jgi:hypothetical protein